MIPIIAGCLLLWLGSNLLGQFLRANPATMARRMRQGGGFACLCAALLTLVTGRIDLAIGLGALGFWLTSGQTKPVWGRIRTGFAGRPGADGVSRVRSATIEMELRHATGTMTGVVVGGPFAGRGLDGLDRAQLEALHASCLGIDPEGGRLLEAYFDRRFPGWRTTAQHEGHARGRSGPGTRPARPGSMSEQEAYKLLGLAQGASRDEIARAHRTLMKKFHPDHGGSTDLAARVNEAKDVLMRRHPS